MVSAEIDAESSAPPEPTTLPARTVFFDGVCNFCEGSVQWLLQHDERDRLHFAPLQGTTAAALRQQLPDFPAGIDTIVYVDTTDCLPAVTSHSRALFQILAQLDAPARRWTVLRFLPAWLLDPAYRAFGRSRYRLFGRRDSCSVPSPEVRARFLP
jgi:predicted DCC family thiol-disulfide oxidoreductase YuxK